MHFRFLLKSLSVLQTNRNPNSSVSRQEHTYRDGLFCLGAAVQFPIWLLLGEMLSMAAKSLHGSLGSWKSPKWLNSLTTQVFLQIVLKRRVTQNWGNRMATTKLLQHLSGGSTQAKCRLCGSTTWISFQRAVSYLCTYITYSEKHKVKNEGMYNHIILIIYSKLHRNSLC